jgi:hypothetical protein
MRFTESIVENAAQRDVLLSKPLSGELRVPVVSGKMSTAN